MTTQEQQAHRWVVFSDILVSSTRSGLIDQEIWDGYIDALSRSSIRASLALTLGSVDVNSVQRRQVSEIVTNPERPVQCVVVTDNALTRGIATAVSWFGANLKAFSWRDLGSALDHLEPTPEIRQLIELEAQQFKDAML